MRSDFKSLLKELLKHFLLFTIILAQIIYKIFDEILNILALITLKIYQVRNKKDLKTSKPQIIKLDNKRGEKKENGETPREVTEAEIFLKNYFIWYRNENKKNLEK